MKLKEMMGQAGAGGGDVNLIARYRGSDVDAGLEDLGQYTARVSREIRRHPGNVRIDRATLRRVAKKNYELAQPVHAAVNALLRNQDV